MEMTRCKDCMFWVKETIKEGSCRYSPQEFGMRTTKDYYCFSGKPKTQLLCEEQ